MSDVTNSPSHATVEIREEGDIFRARNRLKELLKDGYFSEREEVRLYTIASELTRNVVKYAGRGSCEFLLLMHAGKTRLRCICRDKGPGIVDIDAALSDGFSTGATLGIGLPGVKRIADRFIIATNNDGTVIEAEVFARDIARAATKHG
jgi:serine/threonine-protein kinase RsbT